MPGRRSCKLLRLLRLRREGVVCEREVGCAAFRSLFSRLPIHFGRSLEMDSEVALPTSRSPFNPAFAQIATVAVWCRFRIFSSFSSLFEWVSVLSVFTSEINNTAEMEIALDPRC